MLAKTMKEKKFTLLISLPKNDIELARAALEAGADGVKVHMNVDHYASGNHYGTLSEQIELFEQLSQLKKETGKIFGVVPGEGDKYASEDDFKKLQELGFDFISSFIGCTPTQLLTNKQFDLCAALGAASEVDVEDLEALDVDVLELSIVDRKNYRTPLSVEDVAKYARAAKKTTKPLLIPSQKKIRPEEVKVLYEAGCKGIMLGAVVFEENNIESYKATIQRFKEEIDKL